MKSERKLNLDACPHEEFSGNVVTHLQGQVGVIDHYAEMWCTSCWMKIRVPVPLALFILKQIKRIDELEDEVAQLVHAVNAP